MPFAGHVEAEDFAMLQRVLDDHCATHGDDEANRTKVAKAILHFFHMGHTDHDALHQKLTEWREALRQDDGA